MPLPLLRTKLHRPPATGAVRRERLFQTLDEGRERALTLVSAPAGFGKTTLVSGWVEDRSVPAAWFSIDEGDADPARFWSYVVAALSELERFDPGGSRAVLGSPEPDVEAVVTTLLNELATGGSADGRAVLVLDDLHTVAAEAIHGQLALFLSRLPGTLSVVATTRSDPPLPLARYRARGRMAEIRQRHLRFSKEEVRAYLHDTLDLDLPTDSVDALGSRTEGWAASLHLAGLSLHPLERDERISFVRDFAGDDRYVMDYLVDEVLAHRPARVQRFLLATSVLDRMTDPLCRAVLDATTSGGDAPERPTLAELEGAGLLVIPLDSRREWYRYHHLFQDLLQVRCREDMDAAALLRAASRWCEKHDLVEEAVEYALRAGAGEEAARVLEERFPDLIGVGALNTIRRFVRELPTERVHGSTGLCMAMAYVESLQAHVDAAEGWIERGEQRLASLDPTEERLRIQRAHLDLLRGFRAEAAQDLDESLTRYLRAREGFEAHGMPYLVPVAEQGLAGAFLAAEALNDSVRSARHAWSLGLESGNLLAGASGLMKLGMALSAQGRLREAEAVAEAAAAAVRQRLGTERGLVGTYLGSGFAPLLIHRDRLDEAEERIREAEGVARVAGYPATLARGAMGRLRLALARRDWPGAQAASDDLEALFHTGRVVFLVRRLWEVLRVQLWLGRGAEGDLRRAAEWAAGVEADGAFPTPTGVALARVAAARGETREAAAAMGRLVEEAARKGAHGWRRKILVLRALTLDRLRDRAAVDVLAEAVRLAEPEDDRSPFLEEGPAAADLLARVQAAKGDGVPLEFVGRLQGALASRAGTEPGLLTDRELDVLRLLHAGLSNREVAERLFLSVGTVKKHSHNIYRKLGASRRSEALAKARERGILEG